MKNLIDATKQFGYTNQWMTSLDRKGRSPLILASMHGYTSVVELIIKEIIGSTEDEELRKYFKENKDDALILHSHKFLDNKSNNEKDFIVLNLTKGK